MNEPKENWEQDLVERLATAALLEQRRTRRWGIFFKLLAFGYLTLLILIALDWRGDTEALNSVKHTALVELNGVIQSRGDASADHITAALHAAFKDKNTQGVVLRINSPGGSPVQAGIIYDEIRRLKSLYPAIPLYSVVEDVCASGGYYVAAATDRIYVDKGSIVGSIGVIMDGWGFTGTMDKLGVERRVLTSGQNKAFLDPFSPADEGQKNHAKQMLGEIHEQFIEVVKKGRGKRLKESPEIFSGLMWTGAKSIDLGLADAFGSLDYVAREVIKADNIVDFTQKESIAERFAKRIGAGVMGSFTNYFLEARASFR
jgi:protease-4